MRQLLSKIKRSIRRAPASQLSDPASELEAPPRPKPVHTDPRLNAALEQLPAEVRRYLLFALDLTTLRALTSASPVYHQQYRLDRRLLLKSCLEHELCSVIPDACAVHQSGSAEFSAARTEETITKFVQVYHETRSSSSSLQVLSLNNEDEADETNKHKKQELSTEDISHMALFHINVILPMAQDFTKWTLTNLSKHADQPNPSSTHLSSTEKTRVIRALYRFQLYCNLFGMGHYHHHKSSRLSFDPADVLRLMLCPFEPWEVEEIAGVALFVKNQYNDIFDRVQGDLEETHPRFADQLRPPTPDGAFHLEPIERHDLLPGTSSRGLKLLHKALTLTHSRTTHEDLVLLMQQYLVTPCCSFIGILPGDCLSESADHFRRQRWPNAQDARTARRETLPFVGDGVESPPLVWTWLWRGTYSNMYGWWIPNGLGPKGYVFWDWRRWEGVGGMEGLERMREKSWDGGEDEDPRDWNFI